MKKSKKYVDWFLKYCPDIKQIMIDYRKRTTMVKLKDGRHAIVKQQNGDRFDFEKGILWAYMKVNKEKQRSLYDVLEKAYEEFEKNFSSQWAEKQLKKMADHRNNAKTLESGNWNLV